MPLTVLKDGSFYSLWPMKTATISSISEMYEKMDYVVSLVDGRMHIRRNDEKETAHDD